MTPVTTPEQTRARVEQLREELRLAPHPEGGFFVQHYCAATPVGAPRADSPPPASTAIYYLLCDAAYSAWHRIEQDELWHHYEGALVELHLVDERAGYRRLRLGPVDAQGARPSQLVPAGTWQAACPVYEPESAFAYALVGNTVAPGFDFSGWILADEATLDSLAQRHPSARAAIERFSARRGAP